MPVESEKGKRRCLVSSIGCGVVAGASRDNGIDEGREVWCVIHREIMMDGVKSLDWQDMTADDQGSAHTSLPLQLGF